MPPGGAPVRAKLNTDQAWGRMTSTFKVTIPAHMRGVRDAVRHMQQIRRFG